MMSGWVKFWCNMPLHISGIGKCLLVCCLITINHLPLFSQDRCGIVEYNSILLNKNLREDDRKFERWLSERISNQKARVNTAAGSFKIPVVVHVIHNGEAVGMGTNISDAQIASQIKVLN